MIWHTAPLHEVLSSLHTDRKVGLPADLQGSEQPHGGKIPSFLHTVRTAARTPAHTAAIVGTGIALGAAAYDAIMGNRADWMLPLLLCILTVTHILLSALPVHLQNKSDADIAQYTACTARVRRNGKVVTLPSEAVMPGDILELQSGDIIAADCRLIECHSLYCDEHAVDGAALTDEKQADIQLPVSTPFAQRINMVYAGCSVVHGRGLAVAVQTGENTREAQLRTSLGDIRKPPATGNQGTALLLRYSAIAAAVMCAVIVVCGILRHIGLPTILLTAAVTVFAAVPSGLSAISAAVSYATARRCKANGALLRTEQALSRVAAVTMVCTAQAALTQPHPTLVRMATPQHTAALGGPLSEPLQYLLQLAVMSTTDEQNGDPADSSIRSSGVDCGAAFDALLLSYPREAVLPYDTVSRRTATVHLIQGCHTLIVRGDISLLDHCEMPGQTRKALLEACRLMRNDGLRVQAVVCRMLEQVPPMLSQDDCRTGCFIAGLLGFCEDLCEGVSTAIDTARSIGVRTVVCSHDAAEALSACVPHLQWDTPGGIHSGRELAAFPDDIPEDLLNCSVWCELSPEDHVRLITAWQRAGHTVAVHGNCMADIPAMRAADVSFACVQSSEDVAQHTADVLLEEHAHGADIACIRSCRCGLSDLRSSIIYRLSCSFAAALAAVLCTVFFTPLSPVCLLLTLIVSAAMQTAAVVFGRENRCGVHRDDRFRPVVAGVIALTAATLLGAPCGATAAGFALSVGTVLCGIFMRSGTPFRASSPSGHPFMYITAVFALVLAAIPLFITQCGWLPALYAAGLGLAAAAACETIKFLSVKRNKKEA